MSNSTLPPFAFATEIRIRDIVEMYNAAERPQDLDEIIVKVPSVLAVSRALADRDHRANEFNTFLGGCVKPSDYLSPQPPLLQKGGAGEEGPRTFPVLPWGEPTPEDEEMFDEVDGEAFAYGFVNPFGVACDLAKRWIAEGYGSIWLRSDKRIFKSRGMIGNGDDFRRGERRPQPNGSLRAPLTADRIALTNKRDSGGAIANAIRLGQRFAELCEPVRIEPKVAEPCVEIDRERYGDHLACGICGDPTSFCDCDAMATIGRLAA